MATLAPIVPVTLHNAYVSHDFVPVSYMDGFNFYLGHFEKVDGISYVFPDNISSDSAMEEFDTTGIASKELGHTLKPSEVSRYWWSKTFDIIRENPAHEGTILRNKLFALWNSAETFDNYDPSFVARNFPTILNWMPFGFWAIAFLFPFAVIALGASQKRTVTFFAALAGTYAVTLLLFYVTDRYRFPLFILLAPLAGAAPLAAMRLVRSNDVFRLMGATVVACLALGVSLWPRENRDIEAYNLSMLGKLESEAGHYAKAVTLIERGLQISPTLAGSTPYKELAYAKEQLGYANEGQKILEKGMELYPTESSLFYERGRQEAAKGEMAKAAELFRQALALNPYYRLAYYALAETLIRLNDVDEARSVIVKGLSLDPSDELLQTVNEKLEQLTLKNQ